MKETINSQQSLDSFIEYLKAEFEKKKFIRVEAKSGNKRTITQNKAMQLYCKRVADELADKGITVTDFFKVGFELPWTQELVRENIWRPVQKAITGKQSTTDPLTADYSVIYEHINRKLSEHGLYVAWPSKDE